MAKRMDEGWSRREVLAGVGAAALLGGAGAGCTSSGETLGPSPDGAPPPPDAAPDATPLSAAQLLEPIDTIVVLMMENRSYDHFLGSRRLLEGRAEDGLVGGEKNPAPDGSMVASYKLDDYTPADPPHEWDSSHAQWNSGRNDGFVTQHAGDSQNEVMGYHIRDQLPVLYALADGASVCDRWFASVMGPTWPNRLYLHAASSNGVKTNAPSLGIKTIWDLLGDANVSNLNYYSDLAFASGGFAKVSGLATMEQYLSDAAAGTLPKFSIIDPAFAGTGANDDHPSHDIRLGQAFIATVFGALAKSPQWGRCLFVLTYDEHGGFYDHVSPPTTADTNPGFTQLGFRVPSLVAGPFVRRQTVSAQFDHVSVIKTAQVKWNLPELNARVGVTRDLSPCIDPALFTNPQAAPSVPTTQVSWSKVLNRPPTPPDVHAELRRYSSVNRIAESPRVARAWLEEGRRLGVVDLID